MDQVTCAACGKQFERKFTVGKAPKYCSPACGQRGRYVPHGKTIKGTSRTGMAHRLNTVLTVCRQHQPLTVRQAYYLCVVRQLVDKDQSGYEAVQRAILRLRREGRLPYSWIVDNTRWMRKPRSFTDLEDALANTARTYRRDLWKWANAYVEVWCESDSIAGVAYDVTGPWDVPLMPTRGFSSETFAYNAAQTFNDRWDNEGQDVTVIYIGDLDPAGLAIERKVRSIIAEHAPNVAVTWDRLFVTQEQRDVTLASELAGLGTPAKAAKTYGWIGGQSIEAEAIEPHTFRAMLEAEIEGHVDERQLEISKAVEAEERAQAQRLSAKMRPSKKLLELREELTQHNRSMGWVV